MIVLYSCYKPIQSSTLVQSTPDIDFSMIRIRHESIRFCFLVQLFMPLRNSLNCLQNEMVFFYRRSRC